MSASPEILKEGAMLRAGASFPVRSVMAFVLAVCALGLFYQDTISSMAGIWWRSDTYAHGMVVIPIVLYMIWARIGELDGVRLRVEPGGFLILLLLSLLWFIARRASILGVEQFAVVAMLPILVFTIFGRALVRRLLFPLLYLFFMVPMGESLVPVLQDLTAFFTVKGLHLSGIPVFQEGRYLSIPTGRFEVAEACSGIRYLIASLAVGSCYAYLSYRSAWRRMAFVALAAIVPLIANGLRAYGIVMIAHLSEMRLAVGVDHIIYGWFFFGLVMFLLFWAGSFWRDESELDYPDRAPVVKQNSSTGVLLVSAVLAVAVAIPGVVLSGWKSGNTGHPALYQLVLRQGNAIPVDDAGLDNWLPVYHGAAQVATARMPVPGGDVLIYTAAYAAERQGSELINSGNRLYDRKFWRRVDEVVRPVSLDGLPSAVQELTIRYKAHRRLVWYWYVVNGHLTSSALRAKVYSVLGPLNPAQQASAVVAIATDIPEEKPDTARQRLLAFVRQYRPVMERKKQEPRS